MTLSNNRGFTLVELLVVIGMIAIVTAAVTTSVGNARERARIEKARVEVKSVSQAILGYENWVLAGSGEPMPEPDKEDVGADSLGFLMGDGGDAKSGGKLPVLLQASLASGKTMLDPWGKAYKVTIKKVQVSPKVRVATGSMQTGYFLPNWYRLSEGER